MKNIYKMDNFTENDLVYIRGDYFDSNVHKRWSKYVAHIDYRKKSLVGQIKFFSKDISNYYAHILWFADFRIKKVNLKDISKLPENFTPKTGIVNNFNIDLSLYVNDYYINNKLRKKMKLSKQKNYNTVIAKNNVKIIENYS